MHEYFIFGTTQLSNRLHFSFPDLVSIKVKHLQRPCEQGENLSCPSMVSSSQLITSQPQSPVSRAVIKLCLNKATLCTAPTCSRHKRLPPVMIGIPQMFDSELSLGRKVSVAAIQVPSLSSSSVYSHNLHFVMAYGQLRTWCYSHHFKPRSQWQMLPHSTTARRPCIINCLSKQQANIKEQFALKRIKKKKPEILLTRKSSSQYTLPLTL